MVDAVMLALIKKYAGSGGGGGTVSDEEIEKAVEKYMEEHPASIRSIQVNGVTQDSVDGVVDLAIPTYEAIPEEDIRGLF